MAQVPLGSRAAATGFFILQEALSNVRKYAQASQVQVLVENERDFLCASLMMAAASPWKMQ